jgi:hypothetical protein
MPFPLLVPLALTAAGALAGAARGWASKGPKTKRLPTVTPEASRAMNWALQRGQNQYSNPFAGFEPIKNAAMQNFQQQTLPGMMENWSGMGQGNALSSGTFGSQLGAAYRGLGNDLASMQAQYGLQNQNMGMNLMKLGMQPQFENVMYPASDTALSGALGGLSQGLGNLGMSGLSSWMDKYMNQPEASAEQEIKKLKNPTMPQPSGYTSYQPFTPSNNPEEMAPMQPQAWNANMNPMSAYQGIQPKVNNLSTGYNYGSNWGPAQQQLNEASGANWLGGLRQWNPQGTNPGGWLYNPLYSGRR